MDKITYLRVVCYFLLCFINTPIFSWAEGGKNITPANNGVVNYTQASPLNNSIGFLHNGDNNVGNSYSGYFLYSSAATGVIAGDPAFSSDQRLKILMQPGEVMYYGVRRTLGVNALTLRIMATISGVETVIQTTTFTHTSTSINTYTGSARTVDILNCGQPGVICTPAEMNAGPFAVVGAGGYNALSVSLPGSITTATDVWVEFLDDAGGVCVYTDKDVYDLWDFSVYSGAAEKTGRVHSKFWSFNTLAAANRLSTTFALYPAIPNDAGTAFYIKALNLGGMQPFGFSFACNATGTLTDVMGNPTTDFKERRKSKKKFNGIRNDIYSQYDIFVNDPDSLFWPTASATTFGLPTTVNSWCADPSTGRGSLLATIRFLVPAIIQVYGEVNGTAGYQPSTTDVLFEVEGTTGLNYAFWDGRDGLGNILPSGTILNVKFRVQRFPIHYPIYDPENNDLGYRIEDRRPFPNGTTGYAYWEDSQIVPGSSSLIGSPSGSGVHPWGGTGSGINAANIGDTTLMNTWGFGTVYEQPLTIPFVFKCDSDGDGLSNQNDIDDDNDGILDKDESPGVDGILDSDGDLIPDCYDITFAGYVDVNFDGVNDNFDKDGDRLMNQIDLDSDNDGIPDVVESYGVDADGDGRIDNYTDTDNDGLSQNVDLSNSGEPGSVGIGKPDLDGDGIPNYLDRDSDNDGIPDLIEGGGTDATNNGLTDDLNDFNGDGVITPNMGESLVDSDRDGLSNSKDADANNDGIMENTANALILTSTDANGDGRPESYPFKNFDKLGLPNAYDMDSDNDGINDVREAGFADANNDGISDGVKGTDGWDDTIDALASLVLVNTDGIAGFNYTDVDTDNDGIPDNVEGQSTPGYVSPVYTDTDNDGLMNSYDNVNGFGGAGITPNNQDGDGMPDYMDTDTDNDGVIDINEGNDLNGNGKVDDVPGLSNVDTDGDGLDDFFDNDNASIKGTSLYMGNSGSTTGDAVPGSITTVQRSYYNGCVSERDWRCITYVLPMDVVSFTGIAGNKNVTLKWIIKSDELLDKFIIERSFDGVNFFQLRQLNAGSNISTGYNWSYEDITIPSGSAKVYYRLLVLPKMGKQKISNVVKVDINNQPVIVEIHPNPVKSTLQFSITTAKTQKGKAYIISADGKVMIMHNLSVLQGNNEVKYNETQQLPNGIYYLNLSLNNEIIIKKFKILK